MLANKAFCTQGKVGATQLKQHRGGPTAPASSFQDRSSTICCASDKSNAMQARADEIGRRALLSGAAGAITTAGLVTPEAHALPSLVPNVPPPRPTPPPHPPKPWLEVDTRQNLHVVTNVMDLNATVKFYQDKFGMELLRSRDFGSSANAFMGYGPEVEGGKVGHCVLELATNKTSKFYRIGNGFQYFGVSANIAPPSTNAEVPGSGGDVAKDPTGYKFVRVPPGSARVNEAFAQVALQVSDLDKSLKHYTQVLGMQLLRTETDDNQTRALIGYTPEFQSTVFVLVADKRSKGPIDKGEGYVQMAVSTKDVYKTAEQIKAAGGPIVREPGPVPGIGTKIVATTDPDGWKYTFVDRGDFLKEFA